MNVSRKSSRSPLQWIATVLEVGTCSICGLVLAAVVVGLVIMTIPPHHGLGKPLPENTAAPADDDATKPAPNGD